MKKVNWKDVIEFIGMMAIVASLVLVAFELKQNTEMTRLATLSCPARSAAGSGPKPGKITAIRSLPLSKSVFRSCASNNRAYVEAIL
ncbi:MAG: hypothetical protein R3358_05090 [Woeseiaceae bacterium]|nr:hypothetical protein [Woeseiaceae bacterium]